MGLRCYSNLGHLQWVKKEFEGNTRIGNAVTIDEAQDVLLTSDIPETDDSLHSRVGSKRRLVELIGKRVLLLMAVSAASA